MATGRLGIADLAASTNTTLYTCPPGFFGVASVTICNRNATAVTVRLALTSSSTVTDNSYVEYGVTIPANAALERTGLVLAAGQLLVVWASNTSVDAVAYGIETSIT
jgi:hypothetical protein